MICALPAIQFHSRPLEHKHDMYSSYSPKQELPPSPPMTALFPDPSAASASSKSRVSLPGITSIFQEDRDAPKSEQQDGGVYSSRRSSLAGAASSSAPATTTGYLTSTGASTSPPPGYSDTGSSASNTMAQRPPNLRIAIDGAQVTSTPNFHPVNAPTHPSLTNPSATNATSNNNNNAYSSASYHPTMSSSPSSSLRHSPNFYSQPQSAFPDQWSTDRSPFPPSPVSATHNSRSHYDAPPSLLPTRHVQYTNSPPSHIGGSYSDPLRPNDWMPPTSNSLTDTYASGRLQSSPHGPPQTLVVPPAAASSVPYSALQSTSTPDRQPPDDTPPTAPAAAPALPTKRRGKLPKQVTETLRSWLMSHSDHPYPTEEEKKMLCNVTKLSISQVSNWMINARRRILVPASKAAFGPAISSASSAPYNLGHRPNPPPGIPFRGHLPTHHQRQSSYPGSGTQYTSSQSVYSSQSANYPPPPPLHHHLSSGGSGNGQHELSHHNSRSNSGSYSSTTSPNSNSPQSYHTTSNYPLRSSTYSYGTTLPQLPPSYTSGSSASYSGMTPTGLPLGSGHGLGGYGTSNSSGYLHGTHGTGVVQPTSTPGAPPSDNQHTRGAYF